jgi:hypothetical protein
MWRDAQNRKWKQTWMFADWQNRQAEDGRQVVTLPPKRRANKSLHPTG